MEEYDASINFHFTKQDDGIMSLTSDIDNQIDYLSPTERACIIVYLIKDLFSQLSDGLVEVLDSDEKLDERLEMAANFRDSIIQATINFWYNALAAELKEENYLLEFSMVMYKALINKDRTMLLNLVDGTAHSNINTFEPVAGAFALITDSVDNLLENGIPKNDVKTLIKGLILKNTKELINYIDTFDEEN